MNSFLQMFPKHGGLLIRMDYHQIPGKLLVSLILDFLLLWIWTNLFTEWSTVNGQSSVGCIRYGRPLCCTGRNVSCKSRDSPPIRPIYRFTVPSKELLGVYCKESAERIGFAGILPDFVALEGNGQKVLDGKFEKSEHFRLFEEGEFFEFGWPWEEWAGDFEHFQQNWPLVRYSLLNRHLPLRIHKKPLHADFPHSHQKLLQGRQRVDPISSANGDQWRAFTVAETSPDCYCDQMCTKYGDCCANYMAQCPAVDCQLSAWSRWSECMAEDGEMTCGIGIRTRQRTVLRPRENAGAECPINLEQQIGCFRQCPQGIIDERQKGRIGGGDEYIPPDVTTVALLLDYRFNKSRQVLPALFKKGRKNRRETVETGNYVKYCVHYRIEWLNRNCVEPEWSRKLRQGQKICAECQPEAQFHRPRPRCASDLEDGQSGFWKLIGPKSCYGIWRRLRAANSDCDCVRQFPQLNPFLLV